MSNKIFIGDPEEDTVTEPTVVVHELEEKKKEEEEDKSSSRFSSFPIRGLNTLSGPKGEPSQHCPLITSLLFQDPFPSVRGSLRSSTLGATRTR